MRKLLRDMGVGKLAYKFFWKPIMAPVTFNGSRGLIEIPLTWYGEYHLKRVLTRLNPPAFPSSNLNLVFLTGEKHYHQTLLCVLSFIHTAKCIPSVTIYDDGTLNQKISDLLKYLIPGLSIIDKPSCDMAITENFPRDKYPNLNLLREKSFFMRKLMDINIMTPGRLYLDSDMIFWGVPSEMINLYESKTPFFMNETYDWQDLGFICESEVIFNKLGTKPISCFNAGIIYFAEEPINWDLLEHFCTQLLELPAQRFFLFEQTLNALLFSKIPNAARLPDKYYVAYSHLPTSPNTLTHYVASMKYKYMNSEWYRWFKTYMDIHF